MQTKEQIAAHYVALQKKLQKIEEEFDAKMADIRKRQKELLKKVVARTDKKRLEEIRASLKVSKKS